MTKETSTTKKAKEAKAGKLFPDELIDELLAQVQNKDAASILGESGLAGAGLRSNWPNACWRLN